MLYRGTAGAILYRGAAGAILYRGTIGALLYRGAAGALLYREGKEDHKVRSYVGFQNTCRPANKYAVFIHIIHPIIIIIRYFLRIIRRIVLIYTHLLGHLILFAQPYSYITAH
jgi:hypothetical protein